MTSNMCLDDPRSILNGAWADCSEIARHVGDGGTPFPDPLPDSPACDFDAVKRRVCTYRVGDLHSADAFLPGTDGTLYFVEFKDTYRNPLASLKKKAFDSLPVFWASLGRRLSIRDISARAVFVFVRPDGEGKQTPSEAFGETLLFKDAPRIVPPKSNCDNSTLGLQLDELRRGGLYKDAVVENATQFRERFRKRFGECPLDAMLARIPGLASNPHGISGTPVPGKDGQRQEDQSLNSILKASRTQQNGPSNVDFCDDSVSAIDFALLAAEHLAKREYHPSGNAAGDMGAFFHPDALGSNGKELYAYHNWNMIYPLSRLVNKVFDGFLLWAWICHADCSLDSLLGHLRLMVAIDGDKTDFHRHPTQKWLQEFYDVYSEWFCAPHADRHGCPLKYGLACHRDEMKFYDDISTLPVEKFAAMMVARTFPQTSTTHTTCREKDMPFYKGETP